MKNRLILLRNRISESYWFIPGVMVLLSILLSILSIELDELVGRELAWVMGLVYVDSPEGAREVLSAIAGSMITVAGVVFSLTMVVLTLTSQQYGPLVLGNFMRDRGNQIVLGVFTATFTYCLLILRTIRGVENSFFVPHISVLIGIALALISIVFIIYFIHHVSESIRSSNIIGRLADDLMHQIDDLYPTQLGKEPASLHIDQPEQHMPKNFETQAAPIQSRESGYLQMVDVEHLLEVAQRYDLVIDLKHCPGDFIPERSILARVWPIERITPEIVDKINDAMIQGNSRTEEQDVEFIFNKLAMIAVRALSPAINDPYTAIMCIDRLGQGLCRLGMREIPSPYRFDQQNRLRVIASSNSFHDMLRLSFDQIRHYGSGDVKVMSHLLTTLRLIGECVTREEHQTLLRDYAALVLEESRLHLEINLDQWAVRHSYEDTLKTLDE